MMLSPVRQGVLTAQNRTTSMSTLATKIFSFNFLQEFDYQRVAKVLLSAATHHTSDFIQRIAIGLCNLLVCQVRNIFLNIISVVSVGESGSSCGSGSGSGSGSCSVGEC